MDAAMRPEREPPRGKNGDHNRERAYNGADLRPAQNLDTAYRSRWAVNTAGRRRRDHPGMPDGPLPITTVPYDPPSEERRADRPPAPGAGARRPIDLGPLMRLAHESYWARFFNRPRHSAIADA
jgi:hypothetical protein